MNDNGVLRVEQVSKRYGAVAALQRVDLSLDAGEVLALAGKNGAGKSTLIRLLNGVESPDEGSVQLDGRPFRARGVSEARRAGIATVFQELSVVPQLTVMENIGLGDLPKDRWGGIDWGAAEERAGVALAKVGARFGPRDTVGELGIAEQQLVEIARALSRGARVLVLDEPTSSLSRLEVDPLLRLLRRLADEGVGVIYVSHRLQEIMQLADRTVVLRDGRNAGELARKDITVAAITALMTGSGDRADRLITDDVPRGARALTVSGLEVAPKVVDFSMTVHHGEVLGLAGLLGSGRTEVLRALCGALQPDAGEIDVESGGRVGQGIRDRLRQGIALVPEDRRKEGLVFTSDVGENLTMPRWLRSTVGVLHPKRTRATAREAIRRFGIKAPGPETAVTALSGGNQQKIVIAKWASLDVPVLLLDQPTRGVDIESKHQIYGIIRDLARSGTAVVFVSDEFEEFRLCCDRVLVMADGRTIHELPGAQATEPRLMELITAHSAPSVNTAEGTTS